MPDAGSDDQARIDPRLGLGGDTSVAATLGNVDRTKGLSRFGRRGSHQIGGLASPHGFAGDSEGSVYVGESLDGRRVQRFKPVRGGTATSAR